MWIQLLKDWCNAEEGVTSIEYALIAVLIAVVIVGTVTTLGLELGAFYDFVANCVANLSCD